MKKALALLLLCGFVSFVRLSFIDSEHDEDDSSVIEELHNFDSNYQCINNCKDFLDDANVGNNIKIEHVQVIKKRSADIFGMVFSSLSSLLDHLFRLILQPWMKVIGYDAATNTSMDKHLYTVEGRSAADPAIASFAIVNWHELGTTIFTVLKRLL